MPAQAGIWPSDSSPTVSEPYFIDDQRIVDRRQRRHSRLPEDGTDADDLLRNSDVALYRAKATAKADVGISARDG